MAPKPQLANPNDGVGARDAKAEPGRVLTPEIVEFCTGGCSMIFGLIGPDRRPIAGVAKGVVVEPGGRMRITLSRQQNPDLPLAITHDSRIAVTFTEISTHRSIQIKGHDAVLGKPNPEDIRAAQRQTRHCRDDLIDIGFSEEFSNAWTAVNPSDLVVVQVTAELAFVQTPGAGAGARLGA